MTKKVKVTFEEAKNEEGKDFDLDHADSYKAVYYVEPVNEAHPKYQISRNLIVKEAETEVQAASRRRRRRCRFRRYRGSGR